MPAPRSAWAPLAASALLGGALCFDQLHLSLAARAADAAHLLSIPPAWLWLPLSVAFTITVLIGVRALARGGDVRLTRLPAIGAALVLFAYVFLTDQVRPPARFFDAAVPLDAFAGAVVEHSPAGRLESDPSQLSGLLAEVPPPTLFVRGRRVERWALVVRQGCKGPVGEAAGVQAGTLIYCLGESGQQAWITAVDTRGTFGPPEVVRSGAAPLYRQIQARPPPVGLEPPPEPDDSADDAEELEAAP